jgi:copper chaperone CopZ
MSRESQQHNKENVTMQRRHFVQLMTLAGVGSLTALEAKHAGETKSVTWQVKGFTCITCAVGLETMLRQQKGVHSASATYPESKVAIEYYPASVSEDALKAFISSLGFTAEPASRS